VGFFFLFLLLVVMLLLVFLVHVITVIVRIFQRRFVEALIVLAGWAIAVAFIAYVSINREYWRFVRHQSEYQAAVQSDSSAPPRFRVFDWGNRGGDFGSTITFEAIVYDESGEIARPAGLRSKDWPGHQFEFPPGLRWIIEPQCTWRAKSVGEHFYYVAYAIPEECGL
jgi:hypothetical protein